MKIKLKSLIARATTFVGVVALAGVGAYVLVPAKKVSVSQNINIENGGIDPNSYFGRFINKVSGLLDEDSDGIPGLEGRFDEFSVTWPSKSGLSMNDIKIDGFLTLNMDTFEKLNFTLDVNADYNNKKFDLGIGLVDQTLYVSVQDLNLKSTHSNSVELMSTITSMFFDPDNPNGLGINLDFDAIMDSIAGMIDLGSISLDGLNVTETVVEDSVKVEISILNFTITILLEEQTLNLQRVDLGTIKVGDVTIAGAIDFNLSTDVRVRGFDDPLYAGKKRTGEFYEIIGYVGWADRILNLLQTRQLGLDLTASLYSADEFGVQSDRIVKLDSSINLDISNLFDFSSIDLNNLIELEEAPEPQPVEEEKTAFEEFIDGISLDASFNVQGQKDEDYANLSLAYFDRAGYITLNEDEADAVMRAKLDVKTVTDIIEKVPELLATIAPEDADQEVVEDTEGLFDFVTSSELVTAIKDGMYDGILDVLKTLKNTGSTIELELDLSSLGFGEQSIIKLILDAGSTAIDNGSKVLAISAKDVKLGNLFLDLDLSTEQYSSTVLEKTKAIANKFDDLHFVTGVFDQVTHILGVKKGYADIEGKLLDDAGLGFTFGGWLQYDYPVQYGYGSIKFNEYKTSADHISAEHTVDIDVNNFGDNNDEKNMYFEYRDKLKGKFTVQTLEDIIDVVKKLINDNDERFTKFLEPLKEMLLVGVLGEVINNKDYVALATPSVIKKIAQSDGGTKLNIVINKDLLNFENDLELVITFAKDAAGEFSIDYIEVKGLKLGAKNIYVKISLADFKNSLSTPVDKGNLNTFYDFSDISILLDFGINTTKLNVYHLTMPLSVGIGELDLLRLNLDFYIVVDGVSTYVYGRIPRVPWLTDVVSINNTFGWSTVSVEFVFEPSYEASGNDIGGYFHIAKNYDHPAKADETYYYRCESSKFLDNIIEYLITDMFNIRSSIYEGKSVDLGGAEDSNYEDLFLENGFKYESNNGAHHWHIGLDMEALTSSSSLGDLTVELYGIDVNETGYFNNADISMTLLGGFINLSGRLTLENPNPEITEWPAGVEESYQRIIGVYNNMTQEQKDNFDLNYLNKPLQNYKIGYLAPISL